MSKKLSSTEFRAIIDRIEGDLAVLELPDGNELIIPVVLLPREIYDGVVLDFKVKINKKAEEDLKNEVISLQNSLLGKK